MCHHDSSGHKWLSLHYSLIIPIAPVAMAILSNQCQHLLHDDLPKLSGILAAQGAQLIASAVGTLTNQQCQFCEANAQCHANEAKMPDTLLGSTAQSLLCLANVATTANVPPLWQELANAPKVQYCNIVQCHLDKALICQGRGTCTHIVTPSLAKKIASLEFCMLDMDDLSTGIQPFILIQTLASN